jgi:class 3 adenylate cyclase/tetratricopeptide (TPR) repeat protein/DNA-binding XRE family transcriptional regulator
MLSSGKTAAFGTLLRQHRLAAGLTQAVLAERSGIAERTIQDLERGAVRPRRATVRRLVGALALPPGARSDLEAVSSAPRTRAVTGTTASGTSLASAGRGASRPAGDGQACGELAAERKRVTVLAANIHISGSETDVEPDRADCIVRSLLDQLVEIVHRYDGTIGQIRSDGFTALFGAPVAQEDHAFRACQAAMALRTLARRVATQHDPSSEIGCALRVGLDSGEVSVGTVHNDHDAGYTAVGPAVRVAARLAHLADDGEILLSGETSRLVEGHVESRSICPAPEGGLVEPVEIFELVDVGPPRSRFRAARVRPLSGFVGREAELNALMLPMGRARDGRGQVIAVIGEPGVGKSRLVYEFLQSTTPAGWTILEGEGVPHGTGAPYLPLAGLLLASFGIGSSDTVELIREKVAGIIARSDLALETMLPALLDLFDAKTDDHAWAALDPAQRRRQTLDAVRWLLLRESQERPLLLVVEDLHWIDSETQAFLDELVESLPAARLLLLVTYRPEYRHTWTNHSYYTQLRVDPLEGESARQLLTGLVGDDASLASLKTLLLGRTEGNPFFLEESIRSLTETGVLVGERGAYRLLSPLSEVRMPATVQAVLAARIDRLPPEEKALLQAAAVIGKDVPGSLLRALADAGDDAYRRTIGALQAAEFLHLASTLPELVYTFKHALTHEVAYSSLLRERRKTLHARVADAIEATYADRLAEHVERLAHHALHAESWQQAVAYSVAAGQKTSGRAADREAVAYFEQALDALRHLPETRENLEQDIELRLAMRPSLRRLAENGRIGGHLREAMEIAERLGDQRRLGQIFAVMTNYFLVTGELDRAVEVGRRAVAIGEATEDLSIRVTATEMLGNVYAIAGAFLQAVEGYRWILATLSGNLLHEHFGLAPYPALSTRHRMAWCLAELGEFAEGADLGDEAVRLAEALDRPFDLAYVLSDLGRVYLRRGDLARAIAVLERGLAICQTREMPGITIQTMWPLGAAYTLAGRAGEAVSLLERAAAQDVSHRGRIFESFLLVHLGEAYLANGQIEDAVRVSQ